MAAPTIFGALIGNGSNPGPLTIGYYFGPAAMIAGGLIAWFFGVDAERKSLEAVVMPLSALAHGGGTTVEADQPHLSGLAGGAAS